MCDIKCICDSEITMMSSGELGCVKCFPVHLDALLCLSVKVVPTVYVEKRVAAMYNEMHISDLISNSL